MNISSISAAGMYSSLRRFEASAIRTARVGGVEPVEPVQPVEPIDPVQEVVEQMTAKQGFTANLAVLRTGDEMTKRLLDIRV